MKSSHIYQLRGEAAAFLLLGLHVYSSFYADWLLFLTLFFIPDLSILLYLFSNKAGAYGYNISHFYGWPVLFISCGLFFGDSLLVKIGIIWASHLAFDRMLGWGLKYDNSFFHTHLAQKKFPWQS